MANKLKILTTGLGPRLEQHMTDIRGLSGRERLSKGAELLGQMMQVNELFAAYFIELRGLLELRVKPWEDKNKE